MEVVAAVGFAANVLQFSWNTARALISEATEAYQSISGTTSRYLELKIVTEDLRNLSNKLGGDGGAGRNSDVQRIAESTRKISIELLSILEQLRVKDGPHRKWRTVRHALESIWKKNKIDQMQSQLEELRTQLSLRITVQIR